MLVLEKLQATTSLKEFATLLGYKPKALSYILYKIPDQEKYIEFSIPKKNGGKRDIKAPVEELKNLQRRLADLLNNCFDKIVDSNYSKSLSHGFRKKHSIVTNAKKHINKRYVFNVDLKDFFPSINFGRVRGFFIKNVHFKLEPDVATIIAQIACHNNELPQGSPCSPVISNFIGHLLDIRMVGLAKRSKCTYSRYADDLTFSTNQKSFPEKIATKNTKDGIWTSGKNLKTEIERVGFVINDKKTSMQYKTSRQVVTGLIINKKINIKREYYKAARAMCHFLFRTGEFYIVPKINPELTVPEKLKDNGTLSLDAESGQAKDKKAKGTMKQLEGMLSFIYQIKRRHDNDRIGKRRNHPNNVTKLYRDFLFYKYFFKLDKPLILCEGKTDIIYLKCALKSLEKEYPEFVQEKEDGFSFSVKFLNWSKNFKDVFAISEGASGLDSIMYMYKKLMRPIKDSGKKHPVIILIDNDSGSKEINKKLGNGAHLKSFSFYKENLYVVHIPAKSDKKETAIENLFDKQTLSTKIGGKSFNYSKINPKTEYGKIVFAEKVIKPNRKAINFDGFKETLNNIKLAILDYNLNVAAKPHNQKTIL